MCSLKKVVRLLRENLLALALTFWGDSGTFQITLVYIYIIINNGEGILAEHMFFTLSCYVPGSIFYNFEWLLFSGVT